MTLATCLVACAASQEAARVELAVVVDGGALVDATTDLGYAIELDAARIAAKDLEFTILGEMHTSLWRPWDLLIGRAWAHPGHYAGGDVTGALPGDFILDWVDGDGAELGRAELIVGQYHGLNLHFRRADELPADDPLQGHTAYFAGVASKDGVDTPFTAAIDLDTTAAVIGAPFMEEVTETTNDALGVQLRDRDETTGVTLFDGVDFAALAAAPGDPIAIAPGDDAHNLIRRELQSHVHYFVQPG